MQETQDTIQDVIIEVLEAIRDRELKKCQVIEQTIQLNDRLN